MGLEGVSAEELIFWMLDSGIGVGVDDVVREGYSLFDCFHKTC